MSRRYTIPTHLQMRETLLHVAGVGLSARQVLILLIGGSEGYQLWIQGRSWEHWLPPLGLILHWTISLGLPCLAVALAFCSLAGQHLERWLFILAAYWRRPRRCVWRSVRWTPTSISPRYRNEPHDHRAKDEIHEIPQWTAAPEKCAGGICAGL